MNEGTSILLEKPSVRSAILPISVDQYYLLNQAGIIPESTELVRGVILERLGKSPLHTWLVQKLMELFRSHLESGICLRQEQPLTLVDSEPEPDIAIVRGTAEDYINAHPATALLVLEVAVSTEDLDREKAGVYASAGVQNYWLLLPREKRLEIYSQPSPTGYARHVVFNESDSVPVPHCSGWELNLASLFPPPRPSS